jgi:hypothetical protein
MDGDLAGTQCCAPFPYRNCNARGGSLASREPSDSKNLAGTCKMFNFGGYAKPCEVAVLCSFAQEGLIPPTLHGDAGFSKAGFRGAYYWKQREAHTLLL